MIKFVGRRLVLFVVELLAVSVGAFLIVHLAPGNPAVLLAGLHPTPAIIAAVTKEWGLGRPLTAQYVTYMGQLLHGNLGYSMMDRHSVASLVEAALPVTLVVGAGGTVVALILGIPLGVLAGARRGSWVDRAVVTGTSVGVSMPLFWLGMLLVIVFAMDLHWLPGGAYGSVSHLVLPWFALGLNGMAIFARMARTQVSEVLANDYIRTARAKGVGPGRVVWMHALRNAALPLVALLGLRVGYIVAGSIVLELVFLLPGMGQLMVSAILNSDYAVVQGCMLVLSVSVLCANFLADLAYAWVNPIVHYS